MYIGFPQISATIIVTLVLALVITGVIFLKMILRSPVHLRTIVENGDRSISERFDQAVDDYRQLDTKHKTYLRYLQKLRADPVLRAENELQSLQTWLRIQERCIH